MAKTMPENIFFVASLKFERKTFFGLQGSPEYLWRHPYSWSEIPTIDYQSGHIFGRFLYLQPKNKQTKNKRGASETITLLEILQQAKFRVDGKHKYCKGCPNP